MLRDSLHQPQYVEKLEKILRFVIKEKALTLQDLDNIWAAQVLQLHSFELQCITQQRMTVRSVTFSVFLPF